MICLRCRDENINIVISENTPKVVEKYYCKNCGARYELIDDSGC